MFIYCHCYVPLWPVKTSLYKTDLWKLTENLPSFCRYCTCVSDHVMCLQSGLLPLKYCINLKFQPNFAWFCSNTQPKAQTLSSFLLFCLYVQQKRPAFFLHHCCLSQSGAHIALWELTVTGRSSAVGSLSSNVWKGEKVIICFCIMAPRQQYCWWRPCFWSRDSN